MECENCRKNNPPLPEGWTIKNGSLFETDRYERIITDSRGRIDRDKVATILENHGYGYLARRWYMSPAEASAKELRDTLSKMVAAFDSYDARFTNLDLLNNANVLLRQTAD